MSTAPEQRAEARQTRLQELQAGTTAEAALAFYDDLDPVSLGEMIGSWRGEGFVTGNPFDGVLERLQWHGKRFDGPERAHPLVVDAGAGRLMSINPAFVPLGLVIRYPALLHLPFTARIFSIVRPLLSTRKPKARLRLTEYRGVVSATMLYDALPVTDIFRKVDNDTLVGAMDLRGLDRPFMFVLRREASGTR
jgi:Domain of unknown function (DUF4334)/GXWXG protein